MAEPGGWGSGTARRQEEREKTTEHRHGAKSEPPKIAPRTAQTPPSAPSRAQHRPAPPPRGAHPPPQAPAPRTRLVRAQLLHRLPLNGARREGSFLRPAAGPLRGSALRPPLPPGPPHKGISGATAPRLARRHHHHHHHRHHRRPRPAPRRPPAPPLPPRPRGSRPPGTPGAPQSSRPRPPPARGRCPAQRLFIKTTGRRRPSWGSRDPAGGPGTPGPRARRARQWQRPDGREGRGLWGAGPGGAW